MKKIIIEVPDEWHTKIKIHCAEKGISMRSWIFEGLIKLMREEDQKQLQKK